MTLVCAMALPDAADEIVVVTNGGFSAYDDVLAGLHKGVGRRYYVLDLRQKECEQLAATAIRLKTVRVIVTVGSEAAETVMALRPAVPVIAAAAMPRLFPRDARVHPSSLIPVQVPLSAVLENLKRAFPARSRLGIIRNPALPDIGAEAMKATGEAAGMTVRIVDCAGPGKLLGCLQSLKDQVDLVLCFPDSTLYNSATVKPLVLASLRYHLPLVGFSESFVRAGAVFGVFPDFHDLGLRAAELAQRVLNAQPVARIENPRKCRAAVNQNISRLLGVSYTYPRDAGEDFVVVR